MSDFVVLRRVVYLGVPLLAAAALSACLVVPVDPKTGQAYPVHGQSVPQPQPPIVVVQQSAPTAPQAAAPQWQAVQARLYPVNEAARNAGILQATVIDNGAGRGSFSVTYQGQALQGEATRVDRNYPGYGQIMSQVQGGVNWAQASGQRGIANAASPSFSLRCEYLFTAASQGTGACLASDGARYQIHFGG